MPTVVLSGVDPSAASAADWYRFNREAHRLMDLGYSCFTPAAPHDVDTPQKVDRANRLRLVQISRSDILGLVWGWQRSPECLLEIQIAQRIGLEIIEARCLCAPLPADLHSEQPKPGRLMTDAAGEAAIARLRWLRVDRQL